MMYPSLTKSQSMRAKRKSAVELLAESKPFYVKSEIVRDTTQQLPIRPHSNFGGYGTYNRSKSVNVTSGAFSYGRPVNFPQCKYFSSEIFSTLSEAKLSLVLTVTLLCSKMQVIKITV